MRKSHKYTNTRAYKQIRDGRAYEQPDKRGCQRNLLLLSMVHTMDAVSKKEKEET